MQPSIKNRAQFVKLLCVWGWQLTHGEQEQGIEQLVGGSVLIRIIQEVPDFIGYGAVCLIDSVI